MPRDRRRSVSRRAKRGLSAERGAEKIILPISGYGLWSTMYGFIALETDGNTVADITFYAHGETPGLGDFISKPAWRALWRGKRVFDESGKLRSRSSRAGSGGRPFGRLSRRRSVRRHAHRHRSQRSCCSTGSATHGYGPYLRRIQRGDGP